MPKNRVIIIAHNVRSLWNIGAFFRTADAFGVGHIHLTGYTACPPREEIHKTALGAEEWIPWSYERDPLKVIEARRKEGYEIVSLEISRKSVPLSSYKPRRPVCLIVGHEVTGVPKEIQQASDRVVHIPMRGKKESLNVSVALGIALYHITSAVGMH
ncbi:MAG: RNA methyltransferase [Candidatus Peribacteraceae bacterium]